MARPFLAIFVSYYFFIPYRLIIENRRSWEYFQKNRLLTQVGRGHGHCRDAWQGPMLATWPMFLRRRKTTVDLDQARHQR
jgi:hypothetical protein